MRRPDFRIKQDTFLTPFLCQLVKVSTEDEGQRFISIYEKDTVDNTGCFELFNDGMLYWQRQKGI